MITYGGHVQELRHVVKAAGGRVRWRSDGTISVTIRARFWTLKTDDDVRIATQTIRVLSTQSTER